LIVFGSPWSAKIRAANSATIWSLSPVIRFRGVLQAFANSYREAKRERWQAVAFLVLWLIGANTPVSVGIEQKDRYGRSAHLALGGHGGTCPSSDIHLAKWFPGENFDLSAAE
jgi:hypothetical protein